MRPLNWLLAVSLMLATAIVFAADSPPATSTAGSVTGRSPQTVNLHAGSYFFKPDRVTVKANIPVVFNVSKKPGITPHDFVIDAPKAGVKVYEKLGTEPISIWVTFTAPGEYTFYCSKKPPFLKSHRDKGMAGTIIVTE